jgi:hypothetical protein
MGTRSDSLVVTEHLAGGSRLGTCHPALPRDGRSEPRRFRATRRARPCRTSAPARSHLLLGRTAALTRPPDVRLRWKTTASTRSGLTRPHISASSSCPRSTRSRRPRPSLAIGTLPGDEGWKRGRLLVPLPARKVCRTAYRQPESYPFGDGLSSEAEPTSS